MEDDIADWLDDLAVQRADGGGQGRSSGKRGGRGGKGRGGGRGSGGSVNSEMMISKALSRLLRHQAENAGIKLDAEGYAPLDKVMKYGPVRSAGATFAAIRAVVRSNDKQRFTMKHIAVDGDGDGDGENDQDPSHWLIRANQGHSIALESSGHLTPITLDNVPPVVVHGTYYAFWPAILASGGLRRMSRNHVHCSQGLPEDVRHADPAAAAAAAATTAVAEAETARGDRDTDNNSSGGVISGMRRDAELLICLDVRRSLQDGALAWWLSDNGVVLTEGDPAAGGLVPAKYFSRVVGRQPEVDGVRELWRDGERVADLPPGIKARVPRGKEHILRGGGQGRGRGGQDRGKRYGFGSNGAATE